MSPESIDSFDGLDSSGSIDSFDGLEWPELVSGLEWPEIASGLESVDSFGSPE